MAYQKNLPAALFYYKWFRNFYRDTLKRNDCIECLDLSKLTMELAAQYYYIWLLCNNHKLMVFVIIPTGEEGRLRGVQSLPKFAEPKTEIWRHKVRIPWLLVFFLFHHVPIWADIGLLRWKLVNAFSLDRISQTCIGDTEPTLTNHSLETLRRCLKLEEFSNNDSSELFKVRAGRIMDTQVSKG